MSSGDPPLEIRRASDADLPAVRTFIDATYGAGAPFKGDARLHWQFVDNPFRPAGETGPSIFVAVSGDRVVGTIAVQDGCARLRGEDVPMGWIVDVMVHPEFRRRGLGHRIHECAMEHRAALITLTMAVATRRIAERVGCVTLGPTRQFIRPLRVSGRTVQRLLVYKAQYGPRRGGPTRFFNATWIGPALAALVARFGSALRGIGRPRGAATASDIEEVDRFPEELDAFWERTRGAHPAAFERTTRFLNWRFCDAPGLVYRRFLLRRDGELRGYVITRVGDPAELPVGVVADVFASPDDPEALDALLEHAADVLAPHCEFLEAAASTAAYRAAFARAGYFATRTMRATIVCTDDELNRKLAASVDDWHFTKADHDWDQIHPM